MVRLDDQLHLCVSSCADNDDGEEVAVETGFTGDIASIRNPHTRPRGTHNRSRSRWQSLGDAPNRPT